jgi:hypothetical protein
MIGTSDRPRLPSWAFAGSMRRVGQRQQGRGDLRLGIPILVVGVGSLGGSADRDLARRDGSAPIFAGPMAHGPGEAGRAFGVGPEQEWLPALFGHDAKASREAIARRVEGGRPRPVLAVVTTAAAPDCMRRAGRWRGSTQGRNSSG